MSHSFSIFPLEKLSSHVEITSGFTFKSEQFVDDSTQIPLVKGENVQQGYIDWGVSKYWRADDYNNLEKYHLVTGDIVLAMDRPWVTAGLKWAHIKKHDPKSLLVQRVARLRAKNKLNQDYLRFLISSNYFSGYVQPIVTGVNIPHISGKQIGDFKIPLPSLESQKKIAAILSAYDDLIENNKRRIALLENMAEEIYREWFVRFRFPNYKNAEFEKGIPKGWELVTLDKAFKCLGGGTPSKESNAYWKEGDINWYTPSDITGAEGFFLSSSKDKCNEEGLARSSAKMFPAYSIMTTSRATIGATGINTSPACTNQGFITCIPNKKYPLTYLYYWFKLSKSHFVMLSGGATFPELSKTTFKRIEILTPSHEIIDEFDKIVKPIFEQIEKLLAMNENLKESKNSLLPRLISGKLTVENLNIQFPPSMEM